MMANVKIFLTFVFQYSTYSRMSKLFLLWFFDIHHDGECQNFFDFRFSIFQFEYRKTKIKLNYCCLILLENLKIPTVLFAFTGIIAGFRA